MIISTDNTFYADHSKNPCKTEPSFNNCFISYRLSNYTDWIKKFAYIFYPKFLITGEIHIEIPGLENIFKLC